MGDPLTDEGALAHEYQSALDALKGLVDGNPGYKDAVTRAKDAEEKLLNYLTKPKAEGGPGLDLGSAGQVLSTVRDMPRLDPVSAMRELLYQQAIKPPDKKRLYITDDRLDRATSGQPPNQPATPTPTPRPGSTGPAPQKPSGSGQATPKPSGTGQAPKPAPRGERPKLPAGLGTFAGATWDLFLDGNLPDEDAKNFYKTLIQQHWGDFAPGERLWLRDSGLYQDSKAAPTPTPPPHPPPKAGEGKGRTSLPSTSSSSNAISLPNMASAAGPLLILVGGLLATFAGCALTTEHLGVAQMDTATHANTAFEPPKAATAIPAQPLFTVANGTVADVPSAPHIQSGSCSRSGPSTQCNLQLSADPATWASQTHGTVGITTFFDNNAVAISWQDASGVAKPVTSTGPASNGATAAMAVLGPTVIVSLSGLKPTTWGAAIVIQRNAADPIHQGVLGVTASHGGTLPVTDLTAGAGTVAAPATGATAGTPIGAAGGNLNGGCNVIATAVGSHGDTVGVMSAPSAPDAAHPFVLNWDGAIAYTGRSQGAIKDNRWHVDVFGVQVMTGGDDNKAGETSAQGTIKVSDFLPFRFTGLYPVSGAISGSGGDCAGNTWVKLAGSPVGTVPWDAGLALTIFGVFGLASVAVAGRGINR